MPSHAAHIVMKVRSMHALIMLYINDLMRDYVLSRSDFSFSSDSTLDLMTFCPIVETKSAYNQLIIYTTLQTHINQITINPSPIYFSIIHDQSIQFPN